MKRPVGRYRGQLIEAGGAVPRRDGIDQDRWGRGDRIEVGPIDLIEMSQGDRMRRDGGAGRDLGDLNEARPDGSQRSGRESAI
jgi:hypothetical protein